MLGRDLLGREVFRYLQSTAKSAVNVLEERSRANGYRKSVKVALQGILVYALCAAAVVAAIRDLLVSLVLHFMLDAVICSM